MEPLVEYLKDFRFSKHASIELSSKHPIPVKIYFSKTTPSMICLYQNFRITLPGELTKIALLCPIKIDTGSTTKGTFIFTDEEKLEYQMMFFS